uniref:DUF4160 domain-containing protein n=1 Tax=Solibacter usitatus (strain Ellin6076) TaxID=234267 RepID=Q027Y8_SOLUE
MNRLALFINEQSLNFEPHTSYEEVRQHVLATVRAILEAKKIREDLTIIGEGTLSGLTFTGGISVAGILGGDTYKEEWRFLRNLDQASPWDSYRGLTQPGLLRELIFQERIAIGMLWAEQNRSSVVSFGFAPCWGTASIQAELHELDYDCNLTISGVLIANIAKPDHIDCHKELIDSYGRSPSASSLVHTGEGFVARMYFNDHNPPHFHVLQKRDTSETLAVYAIETLDLMCGSLPPGLRTSIEGWARSHTSDLMRNWARCRRGQLPFLIGP